MDVSFPERTAIGETWFRDRVIAISGFDVQGGSGMWRRRWGKR